MTKFFYFLLIIVLLTIIVSSCKQTTKATDELPSWNKSTAKTNVLNFIKNATDPNNKDFVKVEDRIVVFDNDGTLWAEQPLPFQAYFAFDRIKKLANEHSEWKNQQPFKAVLENDKKTLSTFHGKDLIQLVANAHAIKNVNDFDAIVNKWLANAKHPKFNKLYTALVYQPMLELLDYLRANDFKVYIVSGGSMEFMRAWAPKYYGIPKEQIIGSRLKTTINTTEDGTYEVERLPELEFFDDHKGKIISINEFIGKRPVMVVGNSDGDLEMMKYTDDGKRERFMLYLNHTDGAREFLYDEKILAGSLIKGKEVAKNRGWTIIDMKKDWKVVFPFEKVNNEN